MGELKATPLLKDKMWVVERNGKDVGVIQKASDSVTFLRDKRKEKFETTDDLAKKYNVVFDTKTPKEKRAKEVYSFPTKTVPHNDLYDCQNRLPIFTKTKKSKSFYCAGYYLVDLGEGWEKTYCPKLLLLKRNSFIGPFKTEAEMIEKYDSERNNFNDLFE